MDSLKQLYTTYEKPIFRYLYGLTSDYHLAQDLTQETFFQAVKSFHRFRGDSNVTTWLYKIARNVYVLKMRKRTNRETSIENITIEGSDKNNPEEVLVSKERDEIIHSILEQIPEKHRELLLLREWQELSYEEISVITNRSLPWVKINIYRARRKFKKLYEEKEGNNE